MKLWAIGASVLALIILGGAAYLQFSAAASISELESEVHNLRAQLADARADAEDSEARRTDAERRLGELDRELAASKARVTNLSAQLRQSQLEARQLGESVAALEADKQSARDQAARLRRELLEARAQPPPLANEEREELEREIEDLRAQLAEARRSPAATAAATSVDILSVSDRGDVVAVNRGRRDGLAPDRIVLLQRDNRPLARLRLADVREDWAIAHVLERETGQTLAKGSGYALVVTP
ncbi:MAG: hypothetical protein JJU00_07435 [Opitutales bacterium]|nr:hypothetical protein [Opitutales bacterium]